MTNLFQITVCKTNEDDILEYQSYFEKAFQDIHKLTKLLCETKHRAVKIFIESYIDEDPPWLSFDEEQISICAEEKVIIHRDHAKDGGDIFYDFGKRLPANDYFLLAIMAILKHYLPQSLIGKEVEYTGSHYFDDAVRLVNLINPVICNPYTGKIPQGAADSANIVELIDALKSHFKPETTVFFSKHSNISSQIEQSQLPGRKIRRIDPNEVVECSNDHRSFN